MLKRARVLEISWHRSACSFVAAGCLQRMVVFFHVKLYCGHAARLLVSKEGAS
jgi:hypothetical protein